MIVDIENLKGMRESAAMVWCSDGKHYKENNPGEL